MSASPAYTLTLDAPVLASVDRWLSQDEVLSLTGWSDRWLRNKIGSGEIISRLTEKRGANGKAVRAFLAASLPLPAQQRLAASIAEQSRKAIQASPLFASVPTALQVVKPAASRARIVSPTSPEAQLAADRLSKIQPLIDYDVDPGRWHHLQLADGTPVRSKSALVKYLSQTHGEPERKLWRWLDKAKTTGLANLKRKDKGTSRWAEANPRAAELAVHVYLGDGDQPGQSVRGCREAVIQNAGSLGLTSEDIPSYSTILNFLATISPAMTTLARKGRRVYDETFAPYIRRGYTDIAANEVWVSDHMIHDVFVQNDCFGTRDLGHMRLRFTCLLDMRSRMPVGCAWSEEGSSRSITTALRHAVTAHGLPRLLYCDNGKDYQKVARGARKDESQQAPLLIQNIEDLRNQGVFARLGVDVLHCIKFHPQSKHIERMFGTLHGRFDKLYPTYCGPAPHLRPDAATAALERHGRLVREGRAHQSSLPLASQFIREAMHWLATEFCMKPQTGEGMDGRSPLECFREERWKEQPDKPAAELLALLLADRAIRRVRECAVELLGSRYVPADSFSSAQMHHWTTKDVVVAYDANDPDVAVALDPDGHVLAYLQRERLLGMYHGSSNPALAAETRLAIAESMQERKRLVRGLRDGRDALARTVRSNGYLPKVEMLHQATALPASVDDVLTHRPTPFTTTEVGSGQLKQIHSEDIGNNLAAKLAARRKHDTQR